MGAERPLRGSDFSNTMQQMSRLQAEAHALQVEEGTDERQTNLRDQSWASLGVLLDWPGPMQPGTSNPRPLPGVGTLFIGSESHGGF